MPLVEAAEQAGPVDAVAPDDLVAQPGEHRHVPLRLGRERIRHAVQENAVLAERFAVVAQVEQSRRERTALRAQPVHNRGGDETRSRREVVEPTQHASRADDEAHFFGQLAQRRRLI